LVLPSSTALRRFVNFYPVPDSLQNPFTSFFISVRSYFALIFQ
jgi:hypothetical protein